MYGNNPKKNKEGYSDPTAYAGLKPIIDAENGLEYKVNFTIKVLKFIIAQCGFELMNRIEIRDIDTGREFR